MGPPEDRDDPRFQFVEPCPPGTLRIVGGLASPYTQKMVALCRFRRIPYRFVTRQSPTAQALALLVKRPPVDLAPTFYFGDEPMVDSTPIIHRLEREEQNGRSVVHPHPGMAFLADLIEDFGDEFLTKAMYHYRWDADTDVRKAAAFLPLVNRDPAMPEAQLQKARQFITDRQRGRMDFVGSNAVTRPAIEGTFLRVVELLDAHLKALVLHPKLLGAPRV